MAVDVEGDLGGLVTERRLYLLDAATCVDEGAGEEVAQVVKRDRLGQSGASTSSSQLIAELGRVEWHAVAVEEHTVSTQTVLLDVRGEVVEYPLIGRYPTSR